jgi:predicted regulator of Ras-like GTPase activity (Roadblock/LC7/MglB family)
MGFLEILKELVEGLEGGYATTVMSVDGVAVQNYSRANAGCDIETLGIEYGSVLAEIKKAAEILKLGSLEEVSITLETLKVVMRIITPEYFIAFAVSKGANIGKARHLLRKASRNAEKEILR